MRILKQSITMNRNNKKVKAIFILSAVITIFLMVVYILAFGFVQEKSKKVASVTAELEGYLSRGGTIDVLKNDVKETKEERAKLKSYFVDRDDLPEFAKKIESIGDMSGASIEIKRFTKKGNIFSFDITSKGTFSNTVHLIKLMESLPFKVEFKKAYVNTTQPLPGKGYRSFDWSGNFSIELIGFIEQ